MPARKAQAKPGREERLTHRLIFLIKQEVVDKLDPEQLAEERASQALEAMSQIQYLIGTRRYNTGQDKAVGEKMAPFKSSIKKLEMAYQIVAYPLLEKTRDGDATRELVRDAQEYPNKALEDYPHRAPFKLDNGEIGVLSQLARTTGLTLDPKKQEYSFTELIARRDARSKAIMDSYKARKLE